MVWSLILGVLVDLLIKWIESLFTSLNKFRIYAPSQAEIEAHKQQYLDMIQWRIWLGPGRVEKASRVFDEMIYNMSQKTFQDSFSLHWADQNFKEFAKMACKGIKERLL